MSTDEAWKFIRQNASHWYGIGVALVVGGWVLLRGLRRLCRFIASVVSCFCLKYFVYPTLFGGYGHKVTWMEGIVLAHFIGLNAFCIGFQTNSIKEWSSRSGVLSMINLIPLLTGTRFSLAADALGLSLRTQATLHKWLGLMVTCEAIIHTVASLPPPEWNKAQIMGLVTTLALVSTCLISVPCVRRWLYEIFLFTHVSLSLCAVVGIWLHLSLQMMAVQWVAFGAMVMWASLTVLQYVMYFYRNFRWATPWGSTTVTHLNSDVFRLKVSVPRLFTVKGGEYVYLWMPRASFWSLWQSHPFMISWWETKGESLDLSMLVEVRRDTRGMTSHLLRHTASSLFTMIGGPHGFDHGYDEFGTVLMITHGIGIASQLSHIKSLVEGYHRREVRTRRIFLVWQIEEESMANDPYVVSSIANGGPEHQEWVREWMNSLIVNDDEIVFESKIHVLGEYDSKETNFGETVHFGHRHIIDKVFGPPDIEQYLQSELECRPSKLLISVAADIKTRNTVRKWTQKNIDRDMRLVELEFQPPWSPEYGQHSSPTTA